VRLGLAGGIRAPAEASGAGATTVHVDERQNLLVARIQDIVFDCRHPAKLARFWAAVLDDYQIAPYDEAELERLRP
jgi:hypothetical protein